MAHETVRNESPVIAGVGLSDSTTSASDISRQRAQSSATVTLHCHSGATWGTESQSRVQFSYWPRVTDAPQVFEEAQFFEETRFFQRHSFREVGRLRFHKARASRIFRTRMIRIL